MATGAEVMSWSFPVARVARIPIRMHWFLALSIVIEILHEVHVFGGRGFLYAAISSAILLVTIVAHELCHCFMAIRHGGRAHRILLWPLGGLAFVDHPRGLRQDVEVSGVGPVSNFVMAAVVSVGLVATGAAWHWEYLSPFASWYPSTLTVPQWFILHAIRLNVVLALFNCIPAPPLDGGMVAHAVLTEKLGRARASRICGTLGIAFGTAMIAWALLQGELMLGFIGLWMILQSRQLAAGDPRDMLTSSASSDAPESTPRPKAKASWLARKLGAYRARRRAAQIERVLDKVELRGVDSLGDDERRLLRERKKPSG